MDGIRHHDVQIVGKCLHEQHALVILQTRRRAGDYDSASNWKEGLGYGVYVADKFFGCSVDTKVRVLDFLY